LPHATSRSSTSVRTIRSATSRSGAVMSTTRVVESPAIPTLLRHHDLGRAVQLLDDAPVALLDDATPDLQRRRQLAGLDGELTVEDPDLLRDLEAREAGQPPLYLFLDLLTDSLVANQLRRALRRDPLLLRPPGHLLEIGHDQDDRIRTPVTQHDRLEDVPAVLDRVLDRLRRHVLAASRHDQILLPVRDAQVAVLVQLADVARVEPAVLVDRLAGRLRLVVVPLHHLRPPHQDLAVRRDHDLRPGDWLADRAQPDRVRQVHVRHRRGLGEAVAFQDDQPGGVEETRDLRVQWRGAR